MTGTVRYFGPGGGAYVRSDSMGLTSFCNTGIGRGSVEIIILDNGEFRNRKMGKPVTISGDTSFNLDLTDNMSQGSPKSNSSGLMKQCAWPWRWFRRHLLRTEVLQPSGV